MKKSILILLSFIMCAIQTSMAYEYFTIYFSNGTKSEAFYSTDVDSICYSKIGLDSIAYDEWQVQEIYTCDSVYRYSLAEIDSLSFKDVDVNQVAEDIALVSSSINPLFLKCHSSEELLQRLPNLEELEGVERVWTDNQSLFVKIRDWGVTSYSYPPKGSTNPNIKRTLSVPNRNKKRRSLNANELTHRHIDVKKVCVITQMRGDKDYEKAVATSDSIAKMCREWGLNVTVNNDLRPEFFIKDIKQYDLVFLMTHGVYNGSHWLYTNEEIYSQTKDKPVNMDSLYRVAKEFIKTKYLDKGYSPSEVSFGDLTENRNGDSTLVCYTLISSSFISKHNIPKSSNIVVFNAACQSMKGNDPEMAKAFINAGVDCYTGFTESNSIGPWTNQEMCEYLLNGFSIYDAYGNLPEYLYTEELESPENSGKYVYPELILWPENKERTSICITHPETLSAERDSDNGGNDITLKGKLKVLNPELFTKDLVGINYSTSPDMTNSQSLDINLISDKDKHLLSLEATLDESRLEPNTTYYYRAYMYDGYSYCSGEIKAFTTGIAEPYVVLSNDTITFYYDNKKKERAGKVYEIEEEYYINFKDLYLKYDYPKEDVIRYYLSFPRDFDLYEKDDYKLPLWTDILHGNESIHFAVFDASFSNYEPHSTAFWFYGLQELGEILHMEYLNTSNVTNMSHMFYYCRGLKYLYIPHYYSYYPELTYRTSNVTDMSYMFCGCRQLKWSGYTYSYGVTHASFMSGMWPWLENIDTSNVTDMSGMFAMCDLRNRFDSSLLLNTAKVTDMSYMFFECFVGDNLNLSFFNTANVRDMSHMFQGTAASEFSIGLHWVAYHNLNLSSFNTSNVTDMSYMFSGCQAKELDLSNFNTSNVTHMKNIFCRCKSLTTIYAGNWNTAKCLDDAFGPLEGILFDCENLVGGRGSKIGWNLYGYDENGNPLYYYCSPYYDALHIDGGKDNPGLFTAK